MALRQRPSNCRASSMQCHRCHNLDIDGLFSRTDLPDKEDGVRVAIVRNLSRACRKATCRICRFLSRSTSVMDKALFADDYELRAFNFTTLKLDWVQGELIPLDSLVLKLLPLIEEDEYPVDLLTEEELILPVQRIAGESSVSGGCYGRLVKSRCIDLDLVRGWLSVCEDQHRDQCKASVSMLPGRDDHASMKMIDVASGRVVPYEGGRYAALSYCIGSPAYTKRRKDSKRYPKVVQDALQLTKALGLHFLWVDQFCINQNDAAELQSAIASMHVIYGNAFVTIVGLQSSQHNHLPGMSQSRGQRQAVLRTNSGNIYVTTMRSLYSTTTPSKWAERGWCYQEAVLSPRLLLLANDQVQFICRSTVESESIHVSGMPFRISAMSGLRLGGFSDTGPKPSFGRPSLETTGQQNWTFNSWLLSYTTRDLTYQGDILNAFRGVLNTSPHWTLWGIPFIAKDDFGVKEPDFATASYSFVSGLAWSTSYHKPDPVTELELDRMRIALNERDLNTVCYRREGFPSWSWTSCKTPNLPITYKLPGGFNIEVEEEVIAVCFPEQQRVWCGDKSSNERPIHDLLLASISTSEKCLPETSTSIAIQTDTIQLKFCRVHEKEGNSATWPEKFCIDISGLNDTPLLNEDTPGELEDGRYLVDFDIPQQVSELQTEFQGLVLFQREAEWKQGADGDEEATDVSVALGNEFCVMIVEPVDKDETPTPQQSSDFSHYRRAGIVWIEDEHMLSYERVVMKIWLS